MKKFVCVLCVSLVMSLTSTTSLFGQEDDGYNELSVRPVHEAYIMWKKTFWRQMDLNEKQNLPFFSRNAELPKVLIEAVQKGLLIPYNSDSVLDSNIMSKEEFMTRVQQETFEEEDPFGGGGGDPFADPFGGGGGDPFGGSSEPTEPEVLLIPPREFTSLEIKEDVYFDRMRSRMYYDIQSITIFLPGTSAYNPAGFLKQIASFRYKDLQDLFLSMPDEAIWYNAENTQNHLNLSDAFNLRLFSAHIVKYANPKDERVFEIYSKSERAGILASQKIEYDFVDFENELWEF
ncbi:MAG: gliding motility protein GldN [Cyclobacteriaceae bacterium]